MLPLGTPPMLLTSPPNPGMKTSQLAPVVASGPQSATNSITFPTMSNAPTSDVHCVRLPVRVAEAPFRLHSFEGSNCGSEFWGHGSGVPNAATCHSELEGSRFAELRQAAAA